LASFSARLHSRLVVRFLHLAALTAPLSSCSLSAFSFVLVASNAFQRARKAADEASFAANADAATSELVAPAVIAAAAINSCHSISNNAFSVSSSLLLFFQTVRDVKKRTSQSLIGIGCFPEIISMLNLSISFYLGVVRGGG
jgi:hypothetical protein